jgi:dipeptidase
MRSSLPDVVGGLLWFGVDDTASTVYVPMYTCMNRVPFAWAEENGDMMTFTMDAAFWVFNMVANYAYQRYEMIHPDVMDAIVDTETHLFKLSAEADAAALDIYQKSPELAVDFLTQFSVETGNMVVEQWKTFFGELFTKYMDGNVKFKDPKSKIPIVDWPGYPDDWYKRIVEETGDHYRDYQTPSTRMGERKLRYVM